MTWYFSACCCGSIHRFSKLLAWLKFDIFAYSRMHTAIWEMSNSRLKVRKFQNKNKSSRSIWTKKFEKFCPKFWQFENLLHHCRSLLYLNSCRELWQLFLERISCFHSQCAAFCSETSTFYIHLGMCVCNVHFYCWCAWDESK